MAWECRVAMSLTCTAKPSGTLSWASACLLQHVRSSPPPAQGAEKALRASKGSLSSFHKAWGAFLTCLCPTALDPSFGARVFCNLHGSFPE